MPAWDIVVHRPIHSGRPSPYEYHYVVNRDEWKESDGYYNLNKYKSRGEAEVALRMVMGLGPDTEYDPKIEGPIKHFDNRYNFMYTDRKGKRRVHTDMYETEEAVQDVIEKFKMKITKENAKLRAKRAGQN